jgi:hypothetical protein
MPQHPQHDPPTPARHRAGASLLRPVKALRRPAVAATFIVSALAASAAGYAAVGAQVDQDQTAAAADQLTYQQREAARFAQYQRSGDLARDRAHAAAAKKAADRAEAQRKAEAKKAAAQKRAAAKKAAAKRAAAKEAAEQRAAEQRAAAEKAKAERAAERKAALETERQEEAASRSSERTAPTYSGSARDIARAMLASYGWSDQFGCLDALWSKESGWNHYASNPSSGAYGIPQALPGSKMASAGSDWQTNPATQIRWGLGYIRGSYGSPCGAWSHSQATGWY